MVGFGTCKKGHHLPLLVNNDKVIIIIITSCSQGALHTTIFFFSCVAFVFVLVVLILTRMAVSSSKFSDFEARASCPCRRFTVGLSAEKKERVVQLREKPR